MNDFDRRPILSYRIAGGFNDRPLPLPPLHVSLLSCTNPEEHERNSPKGPIFRLLRDTP